MALTLTDGTYAKVQSVLQSGTIQVQLYQNLEARTRFKEGTNTPFDVTYSQVYNPILATTTPEVPATPDVTNADGTVTKGTPEVPASVSFNPILVSVSGEHSVIELAVSAGYLALKQLPQFAGATDC